MKSRPKNKVVTLIALTTFMILGYQNCGGPHSAASAADGSGMNGVGPVQKDETEQAVLASVLKGYQGCDADTAVNECRRSTLEQQSKVSASAATPTPTLGSADQVCYVFGPGCTDDPARTFSPVMAVQSCRNELVTSGLTLDSINALMTTDPFGYAELINSKCLYNEFRCVVAVRCIPRAETVLPGLSQ